MHGVEAPEQIELMCESMDPVKKEFAEDESEGELDPEAPIRWPEGSADEASEPACGDDRTERDRNG